MQFIQSERWCQEFKAFYLKKWHCSQETGLNKGIRVIEPTVDI